MTPAERALLIAIAKVVADGTGRIRLLDMVRAVHAEDVRRPYAERMPDETLSQYNDRISVEPETTP